MNQKTGCSVPEKNFGTRRLKGENFESFFSHEQNLTFRSFQKEFESRGLELDSKTKAEFKLVNEGRYTNLALLLSDQNPYSVHMDVLQGNDTEVARFRQDFGGSIVDQLREVYEMLDRCNACRSTIHGLYREDVRDYPEIALQEALTNLLIHRDYSIEARSFIRRFDNRTEFVSFGGLASGIEKKDILSGLSICRNPNLLRLFRFLHFATGCGSGLTKIMKAYDGIQEKPVISTTKNSFKIVLPNINEISKR